MNFLLTVWIGLSITLLSVSPVNAEEIGETPNLNSKIQKLKRRAEILHHDLTALEQDLLFPASSQLAVYVSLSTELFDIDAVEMHVNGVRVANYLYSAEQQVAFAQGGVQQLYLDNIAAGYLDVTISLLGKIHPDKKGDSARVKQTVEKRFHKGTTGLVLEFVIDTSNASPGVIATLVKR